VPEALDSQTRDLLLQVVRQAARDHILPRFRALAAHEISTKSGPGDLVTLADTQAEIAMTAAIRAALPGAVVVGEEAISADLSLRDQIGAADLCVILDPVDGTWNFAKGLALFGVLLAVTVRGQPVFGLLYDPLLDDWIAATPHGTTYDSPAGSRPLATSTQTKTDRLLGYAPFGLFPRAIRAQVLTACAPYSRVTSLRCACHEYRLLAQGHVEFALSGPVPNAWDHAAGALAVQAAGGVARFIDGGTYDAGRARGVLLVASSQAVWDQVAAQFAFLADI
jgi:fructose-1,6-bisphosphatase/inositol monophosphatase family enzyme